ncbi:MAG: Uma2 family endonuclease [Magnetococcus sp. YQC-5]
MNWQEVCEDTCLKDLPFKIELNHWGKIVMSPAKNRHSVVQGKILRHLFLLSEGGEVMPECSIRTSDNVKVADVAWISSSRYQQVKDEIAYSLAPEICVEVVSSSNTKAELIDKMALYFASGAQEVWLCSEDGSLEFHAPQGQLARSGLFPEFPDQMEMA